MFPWWVFDVGDWRRIDGEQSARGDLFVSLDLKVVEAVFAFVGEDVPGPISLIVCSSVLLPQHDLCFDMAIRCIPCNEASRYFLLALLNNSG